MRPRRLHAEQALHGPLRRAKGHAARHQQGKGFVSASPSIAQTVQVAKNCRNQSAVADEIDQVIKFFTATSSEPVAPELVHCVGELLVLLGTPLKHAIPVVDDRPIGATRQVEVDGTPPLAFPLALAPMRSSASVHRFRFRVHSSGVCHAPFVALTRQPLAHA